MKTQVKINKNATFIILFICAALIALFVTLFASRNQPVQHPLTIKEIGTTSMVAISHSEELGGGEITLEYGEDMIVQDVNGQILDLTELSADDRIQVELAESDAEQDVPVIEAIMLVPMGSDKFI